MRHGRVQHRGCGPPCAAESAALPSADRPPASRPQHAAGQWGDHAWVGRAGTLCPGLPLRRRPPVCTALLTFDLSPRLTAPLTPQPGTRRLRGAAPTLRTPRSPAPTPGAGESLLSRVSPAGQAPESGCSERGRQPPGPGGCAPDPDTVPPFPHARPPGSWNLEGLRALGPLATYISSSLWMQVQQVGCSGVGGCPAGLPAAAPLGTGVPSPPPAPGFPSAGREEEPGAPASPSPGYGVCMPALPGCGPGLLRQHGGHVPSWAA